MKALPSTSHDIPQLIFTSADAERLLDEVLEEFEALANASENIVVSPADVIRVGDRDYDFHRYVFLGARADGPAIRLAIYAGWEGGDLRPTYATLALWRQLALRPGNASGYNLFLYPIVNPAAFDRKADSPARHRDLARERWSKPESPEIQHLARDVPVRGFDGWISVSTQSGADHIEAAVHGLPVDPAYLPTEYGRFHIRWLALTQAPAGPADLAEELPVRPVGLQLKIPGHWPDALYSAAVSTTIRAFLERYREVRSYAAHL